ncbi:unnamed protein product [Vitrella brassicaformis CCMP3155]|uniref:Actin n=1 Tax=Vitrella brassicaformis (strain CCMP3155) TaxID=1169540 RepID=A0A0G4GTV0_VITBC|nr:unnamed protein product [Vitrella brassicaformis CCMP3155]|mmetsp:Transcript_14317/g.34139  ORF Transcript_14317/g.34139 Transcript_14317/m.34139 type:complete len:428 (-) Transcript_14317:335-1618(-)|eukprot:CEM34171.1 unnamed protein product [Vitrella brassicaformis CCMP3155]
MSDLFAPAAASNHHGQSGPRIHDACEVSHETCLIIDNGTGFIKAGLSTAKMEPTVVIPTLVGRPKPRFACEFEKADERFVGDAIDAVREKLTFEEPIVHGAIEDWMEMEELWSIVFDSLGVMPDPSAMPQDAQHHGAASSSPVLLTEPPLTPSRSSIRSAEIMFEYFRAPELRLATQGVLALLGLGKTTGVVVEMGDAITQVVPVYDGYALRHGIRRVDLGGQDITMLLQRALCDRGYPLTTRTHQLQVRRMKENCCFVAQCPESASHQSAESLQVAHELSFSLSNHESVVCLDHERYLCPEVLFHPSLIHRELPGLGQLVWQAIESAEIDTRQSLWKNIFLTGGSSLFSGLQERLQTEVAQYAPEKSSKRVTVHAWEGREHAVYQGAAQVCAPSIKALESDLWIKASEYAEEGPNIVQRKAMMRYN